MLPSITCGSAETHVLLPIASLIAVCMVVLPLLVLKSACAKGPSIVTDLAKINHRPQERRPIAKKVPALVV